MLVMRSECLNLEDLHILVRNGRANGALCGVSHASVSRRFLGF